MAVRTPPVLWAARVLWLLLPLGVGDLLVGRPGVAGGTSWAAWVVGLAALFVAHPTALTGLRVVGPLPLVVGTAVAVASAPGPLGWAGLAAAAVVWICILTAEVGDFYVNGASYGDERRFTLRAPAVLTWAVVPAVWLVMAAPVVGAVVLAGHRRWVLAGLVALVAVPVVAAGTRSIHRLATRWLVMVPAGITVVDPLNLTEPVLFAARDLTRFGPAHVATGARDLTGGASGLVLQLDVTTPVEVTPTVGRGRTTSPEEVRAVLVCPSRPGAVLAEADRRGLAVSRD